MVSPARSAEPPSPTPPDSELEEELTNLFTRVVSILGLPRSLAEIYAVLFASIPPLNMDDVLKRSRLSQGAVSQGIRQLRGFGAIRPVYRQGDRRTFYEVEENLRKIAAGFLREQVLSQLEDWPQRLERIDDLWRIRGNGDAPGRERAENLTRWHRRVTTTIPVLLDVIGSWEEDRK